MKIKQIATDCIAWYFTPSEVHQDAKGAFILFDKEKLEGLSTVGLAMLSEPTEAEILDILPEMTQEQIDAEIGQQEYKAEKSL